MKKSPELIADEDTSSVPLDELGWRDSKYEDFERQRDYLEKNNGIRGLEILAPGEVERAKVVFVRDGFVVVRDALDRGQLDFIRAGCDEVIREILALDKNRNVIRGSHRYYFVSSSKTGHLMHRPEWAMLLDLPTINPILTAIFGSSDYIARGGGGGDARAPDARGCAGRGLPHAVRGVCERRRAERRGARAGCGGRRAGGNGCGDARARGRRGGAAVRVWRAVEPRRRQRRE